MFIMENITILNITINVVYYVKWSFYRSQTLILPPLSVPLLRLYLPLSFSSLVLIEMNWSVVKFAS